MCHVSNKMQKSQFNAKYDCPHEEAATHMKYKALSPLVYISGDDYYDYDYYGLVSPKSQMIKMMVLGCQDLTL